MALPPAFIKGILQLAVKKRAHLDKLKSMKAGTFAWKGKAKDYPGALNIKQGMTRKGKPKLRIV